MSFETVIGMEAHAQLLTRSKMFCDCAVPPFDARPNTFTCPVCLGLPGSLPTVNQRALELAGLAALALNCQIGAHVKFDRKNYHYPDLPKGYQISQYDLPLARDGWLDVETDEGSRRIRIRRVHLEEDTAKLFHRDGRDDDGPPRSLVDFNRSGIPLIEIVTEPDLQSAAEARAYVEMLRQILRWLEVSSGDMEKGSIRLEPNISIRPAGSEELGTRTEIKNLNSFRTLELFLTKEAKRQREVIESGGQVEQETLGWDEAHEEILVQRTKEFPDDYRYFPEPDLPPLVFSDEWVDNLRARLPELPDVRKARLVEQYELTDYAADVLTSSRALADYFEETASLSQDARVAANWIQTELLGALNQAGVDITEAPISPSDLAGLLQLISDGTLPAWKAKSVFEKMLATGEAPDRVVSEEELRQEAGEDRIKEALLQSILNNLEVLQKVRKRREAGRFYVGRVMKASQGRMDPKRVSELLKMSLDLREALADLETAMAETSPNLVEALVQFKAAEAEVSPLAAEHEEEGATRLILEKLYPEVIPLMTELEESTGSSEPEAELESPQEPGRTG